MSYMYFKQHKRVRGQNVCFEIVTAVTISNLLDVTSCSTIRHVSTFRMNVLPFSSESHDFDVEYHSSSFI